VVHVSQFAPTELSARILPLSTSAKRGAWAARWAEVRVEAEVWEWAEEKGEAAAEDGDAGWLK